MNGGRSSALAWWSAMTIFVSAFLLFQVQPVISKKILPWFGGSPAVWTTCVLFFQVVLLAGYAYAHWLIRYVSPRRQGLVHLAVLGLALLTLFPTGITPGNAWKPADGTMPEIRILLLLLAKVGAPYFLLSSTGPLVQAWFSQLYPGRSPYRLYALSNVGSLGALLTYPFLFEVNLRVNMQGYLWSAAFVLFAVLIGILAWTMWRESNRPKSPADEAEIRRNVSAKKVIEEMAERGELAAIYSPDEPPPPWWLRIGWLGLAALGSMAFLAITNHLSQDIAVVPFMWVIPLSLYLLSFIICFDNERWYSRKFWGLLTIFAILWFSAVRQHEGLDDALEKIQTPVAGRTIPLFRWSIELPITFTPAMDKVFDGVAWLVAKIDARLERSFDREFDLALELTTADFQEHVIAVSTTWVFLLFLICMVCHGELVKSKPAPKYLTSFFLSIAAGGALGGMFVALICPLIFRTHFELPLTMILGFMVGWLALANDGRHGWLKGRELAQWSMAFVVVGSAILVANGHLESQDEDVIYIDRNFYGTVTVSKMGSDDDEWERGRALYNGRIWHGFQYLDESRQLEPTTYYVAGTGAAAAVNDHPRRPGNLRVAVVGLGTGSMAAHGRAGDLFRFYEIDPKIERVARKYFTYLDKSPATTEVVLGDGRIAMERELADGPENYDVILLDAFSGDAIPAHLLTYEAFALYEQHLRKDEQGNPEGVIVVHISNRYLDLEPVVYAIAKAYGYDALSIHTPEQGGWLDTASDWVLVSKNKEFMEQSSVASLGVPLKPKKELLWTDQYTALFPILQ